MTLVVNIREWDLPHAPQEVQPQAGGPRTGQPGGLEGVPIGPVDRSAIGG